LSPEGRGKEEKESHPIYTRKKGGRLHFPKEWKRKKIGKRKKVFLPPRKRGRKKRSRVSGKRKKKKLFQNQYPSKTKKGRTSEKKREREGA